MATLRAYDTTDMGRDHGLDALCNLIQMTFGVPMAAVTLIDDKFSRNIGMAGLDVIAAPADTTFCLHVIEMEEPLFVEDATKDDRFAANPFVLADPGVRCYLGVPLFASDGCPLGAICAVDTKSRCFSEEERRKLSTLAVTAMQILEMRRRIKEVRTLAVTDGLTGIANRAGLELEIEKAIAVQQRHGLPFSLLYIDVDGFKQVNDERGHGAGDHLLNLIGRTLADRTRREETSGRLGGDEFAVLMIGAQENEGREAAASIKEKLDAAVAKAGYAVSFSMGLALFSTPPNGADGALNAADRLLYEAKRGGKDRIAVR